MSRHESFTERLFSESIERSVGGAGGSETIITAKVIYSEICVVDVDKKYKIKLAMS